MWWCRERVAPDLPKLPVVSPFDRWDGVPILNTGSFFGWDEPRKSQHGGKVEGTSHVSQRIVQSQHEGQKMGGLGRSNTAWVAS
jgi:hypothetical protein